MNDSISHHDNGDSNQKVEVISVVPRELQSGLPSTHTKNKESIQKFETKMFYTKTQYIF